VLGALNWHCVCQVLGGLDRHCVCQVLGALNWHCVCQELGELNWHCVCQVLGELNWHCVCQVLTLFHALNQSTNWLRTFAWISVLVANVSRKYQPNHCLSVISAVGMQIVVLSRCWRWTFSDGGTGRLQERKITLKYIALSLYSTGIICTLTWRSWHSARDVSYDSQIKQKL